MRLVRFTKRNIETHKASLSALKRVGPIISGSRPYIGWIDKKRIISCVWIDEFNEISIITLSEYRNQGLMSALVKEVILDVFNGRLDEVTAMPMNSISKRLLRKCGMFQSVENKDYLEFYIK